MSKKIFTSLSETAKEDFFTQIESVEKDLKHKNTVKLRVRPRVIDVLCKIAGVHDIRGGAYRADTVYIGHSSDLFNPQLLEHESIHIDQQVELKGFIRWLKKTVKDMKKYKELHGDSPYIKYESSTLTPMELEAYTHQADVGYLKKRKPFAYKKYETPKGEQKAFKTIENRNTQEVKEEILDDTNDNTMLHDLIKLKQIIKETKDNNWTMRVFNSVDKVNEMTAVLHLLERKLLLLRKNPDLQNFSDIYDKEKYTEMYWNRMDEFTKEKEKHQREINNNNLNHIFEDDFMDQKTVEDIISKLSKDIHTYRKEPTRFWLEQKKPAELLPLLEKKLFLLQKDPRLQTFSSENDERKYTETYWNRVDEFIKEKNKHSREIRSYKMKHLFKNDFADQELIKKAIEKIQQDIMICKENSSVKESIQVEIPLS